MNGLDVMSDETGHDLLKEEAEACCLRHASVIGPTFASDVTGSSHLVNEKSQGHNDATTEMLRERFYSRSRTKDPGSVGLVQSTLKDPVRIYAEVFRRTFEQAATTVAFPSCSREKVQFG